MRPETIRERVARIRLSRKALAQATGLVEMTIGRTLNGETSPNMATFEKIEKVVIEEEIALRDYLLTLHPVKQEERAA
ncbi:helix-turn-helix transcriptional regulator [Bradyrhizobium sp. RT9a]|uniref:helix-turn-helix domain-containing protein n=1 Tax=Bradyrhizobium sp. RT9a TaxID=3156384 RepID=UPI0033959E58